MTELHVERRIFVPLAQIPPALRDAIIATEDRRFYSHWGVDPIGIARAVVQNYRRGRIVEGGSTITQQLAKVLFLTADKSLERKLKEAVLALIAPERRRTTGQYFLDYVQQTLEAKYGADLVFKGGLNIYTTLSPSMQLAAEQAMRDGLKALEGRSTKARPGENPEGAIITIEPQTGYVKAMVGGYDFLRSEFNRAVQAKRQPGSAFKPFIYIAALEAGFTPATRIEDSPVTYPTGSNGQTWKPENYDRIFRGPTTLQQAIEESVNVVTVKLQERVGINRTVQVARRLGITSPLDINLSLALGTSDLSLLELTSAYGALAHHAVWMPPVTVRYITDAQGKLLEEHVPEGREAVAPETAYVIAHMLRGVVERGTGQAAKVLGRPIAAKTGTTNDYSNAWFVGFTTRLTTGVWVGYDRPRSLGKDETGSRVAVPIWVAYMGKILGDSPKEDFPAPEGVVSVLVDEDPSGECVRPVPMAFIKGTEPAATCAGVGQRRADSAPVRAST